MNILKEAVQQKLQRGATCLLVPYQDRAAQIRSQIAKNKTDVLQHTPTAMRTEVLQDPFIRAFQSMNQELGNLRDVGLQLNPIGWRTIYDFQISFVDLAFASLHTAQARNFGTYQTDLIYCLGVAGPALEMVPHDIVERVSDILLETFVAEYQVYSVGPLG